jgi:serine protease Do
MKKITNLLAMLVISVTVLTSCSGVVGMIFPPNYKQITNDIFTNYIEMNLMVETYGRSTNYEYRSQGSGVIFDKNGPYYYFLTNAHVLETVKDVQTVSYTVYDCYGNDYIATLVASDRDRDLAILKFIASEELCVAALAEYDPIVGENVVVLSTSNHLINSVTFGKIKKYDKIKVQDENGKDDTRVTFPVICHNAPMWSGGSGSVLLNMNMEIVGINYATNVTEDNAFVYGYAVSISHVREFLKENYLI